MSEFLRVKKPVVRPSSEHPSRLADPAPFPEDVREERRLRPPSLAEFVGQPQLREQLGIFLAAARQRGEAMDHVLFHGPPGLGKTTLASIVAHELGVEIRNSSGPVLEKAGDLVGLILQHHADPAPKVGVEVIAADIFANELRHAGQLIGGGRGRLGLG